MLMILLVIHVLVEPDLVEARSWRDVLSEDDPRLSLRGNNRHQSRPGELGFEIEEDPFYVPSPVEDDITTINEELNLDLDLDLERKGETEEQHTLEDPRAVNSRSSELAPAPPPAAARDPNVSPDEKTATTVPTRDTEAENVFVRQSLFAQPTLSSNAARKRNIHSYRTSRDFVPPTESPADSSSSVGASYPILSAATRENPPPKVSSPTQEASIQQKYVYPEHSVTPPVNDLPRSYFNYDTSVESMHGPGYSVVSNNGGNDLVVEYFNNAWTIYEPPPPIQPSRAMAIANGVVASSDERVDYFYWDEFGPDGLGFGPWKDTLKTLRTEPNLCGSVGWQSPIDIRPNGVACLEHHQIRTRRGDFRVFGTKNTLDLSILPNKLRVQFRRRPCRQIENPVCSEPDPPHADFPHGWPGFADVLHVDFKFPAEHHIHGKAFDGEMQIYYLHPGRKRLPVVTVLMEVVGDDDDDEFDNKDSGHNEYLQEAIDGFQYEYDANKAGCAKSAIEHEHNRRLQKENSEGGTLTKHRSLRCDSSGNNKMSMKAGNGSPETEESVQEHPKIASRADCQGKQGKHGVVGDDRNDPIEALANATFGRNREQLEEYARFLDQDSEFLVSKEAHRRRLGGVWNPNHESLVPSIYFYGYDGSLTEPPCSEIVSWFVIDEPMRISKNQLEQMKTLLFTNVDRDTCRSTSAHYRNSVARPIQETGKQRQIWHCTPNDFLSD